MKEAERDRLRKHFHVFYGMVFLFLFLIDLLTKFFAAGYLKGAEKTVLLDGILSLVYVENTGMAFGLLKGHRVLFLLICLVFLPFLFRLYTKTPPGRRYAPLRFGLVLIASGALGNAVDRFLRGYVVDFIGLEFIDFPVFNLADCFVVVGSILFAVLVIFFYEEGELHV